MGSGKKDRTVVWWLETAEVAFTQKITMQINPEIESTYFIAFFINMLLNRQPLPDNHIISKFSWALRGVEALSVCSA